MCKLGAGLAQWYSAGLQAGWSGVWVPAGLGIFLFTTAFRRLWGHPAYYPMGTRGSFPGGKAAWEWSWPFIST